MRIAGLNTTEPLSSWASRAGSNGTAIENISAEAKVHVHKAYFIHAGSDENRRPSLRLTGELRSVVPDSPLPHNIQEVYFRSGVGPRIDGVYTFTQDQLVDLVQKGYFTRGFDAPDAIQDLTYDLPVTVDTLVLPPRDAEDVPVVFLDVHDSSTLALNHVSTGYNLAAYFPNVLENVDEFDFEDDLDDELDGPRGAERRDDRINDLFAERDLEQALAEREAEAGFSDHSDPGEPETEEDSEFRRLADERRQTLETELAEADAEARETDPVELFHREHVESLLDEEGNVIEADEQPEQQEGEETTEPATEPSSSDLFEDLDPSQEDVVVTPKGVEVEGDVDTDLHTRLARRHAREAQQDTEIRQRPSRGTQPDAGDSEKGLGD